MNNVQNQQRLIYLDFLRAFATIAVVIFHYDLTGNIKLSEIINISLDWCVPVFLMITGALFFNTSREITELTMLKKTIPRIVGILVIWGGVYNIVSVVAIEGLSIHSALKAFFMIVKADTTYCYQFWYLYFIIGIYFLIPIIKPWVDKHMNHEKPTIEASVVYLLILVVGIIIPSVFKILNYSGGFWHNAFRVYYGLAFYPLCGCWLSKWYLDRRIRRCLLITWFIQLLVLLLNVFFAFIDNSENYYGYTSIFTWETAILLFDFVRRIDFSKCNGKLLQFICSFSNKSLGIYIFHAMILWIMYKVVSFVDRFSVFPMLIIVGTTIIICMVITTIAKRIPFVNKLV